MRAPPANRQTGPSSSYSQNRLRQQRRDRPLVRLAQFGEGERELALQLPRVTVDDADPRHRQAPRPAHVVEAEFLRARDGDDRAARRLREQEGERVEPVGYDETRTLPT